MLGTRTRIRTGSAGDSSTRLLERPAMTSAASASWGTHLGETIEVASTRGTPAASAARIRFSLTSVETGSGQFWKPSRAPTSMKVTRLVVNCSTAFELRLPLLEEGHHALFCVLGQCHQRQLRLQIFQRRPELHVLRAVERIPAQLDDDGRLFLELGGDFIDRGVELGTRHDAVHKANAQGLISVESVAEQQHLQQPLAADVAHQHRLDHHRPDTHVYLGGAKGGVVDGNQNVADGGQAKTARQRMSIVPAEEGLAQLLDLDKKLDEQMPAQVALDLGLPGVEATEVGACAEGLVARAREDDDPTLGCFSRPLESTHEVGEHAPTERVALVGAVQRDRRSVPGGVDEDVLQLEHRHDRSISFTSRLI